MLSRAQQRESHPRWSRLRYTRSAAAIVTSSVMVASLIGVASATNASAASVAKPALKTTTTKKLAVSASFRTGSSALAKKSKKRVRATVRSVNALKAPKRLQTLQITVRAAGTCSTARSVRVRGEVVCKWRALANKRATVLQRLVRSAGYKGRIVKTVTSRPVNKRLAKRASSRYHSTLLFQVKNVPQPIPLGPASTSPQTELSEPEPTPSVPPAPTVPGVPTSVAGVAGDGLATLSWVAPESDGGTTVTGYQVRVSNDDGAVWVVDPAGCAGVGAVLSCTATGLTNGTSYVFQVLAKNSVGDGQWSSSSEVVTPELPAPPASCADGGPCAVGDLGPGGGTVFYVNDAGFGPDNAWTYLEAAPLTAVIQLGYQKWGCFGTATGITATAIGTGAANTAALVAASCGSDPASAAIAADGYSNNGKDDWFLPSADELNQLCRWNGNNPFDPEATTCEGGGWGRTFWGSSQDVGSNGQHAAWSQHFFRSDSLYVYKFNQLDVWPVRAFASN